MHAAFASTMRLATATALLSAALVGAQNQMVQVQVGAETSTPGGIFQFMPNNLTASNGSVITFTFSGIPGNHSVTQSTFAAPCTPFKGGFDSGWVEILANTSTLPTWQLTITSDQIPIWFYCKQKIPAPHCNAGMVGGINIKPGPNSLAAFVAAAQKAPLDMHEGGLVGLGASASALPAIDGGATLFMTDSATAGPQTAAGGSAAGAGTGAAPSGSGAPPPSSAGRLGFDPALLLTVVVGAMAGAAMVL
ncbi:hypothetical protein MIND_00185500 [Mycena indigotica]|uniref:Extracellular serine-rich protein n=1 Tax=Mycena indigotica TaxID=2126181 RepID=A0A8H6T7G9_9AGAR|nr:uncharacterized protein MIND_00185500 [Mycena indigotica]KAF7311752.1 hypothetical protein MIND_00185500 [Mycena indigotica]